MSTGKYRAGTECQFNFTRAKARPLSSVDGVLEISRMRTADTKATDPSFCACGHKKNEVFISSETRANTTSWSQARHHQHAQCLLHLSRHKCLFIIPFLQKWNNSSYCFSHKRDHCVSATYPHHISVGGHCNNKGSSRVQTDFHCYSPKIWIFFSRKSPLLSNYAWIRGWLFLSKAVGRGGQKGKGWLWLQEARGTDKRLKKAGHWIKRPQLPLTIWCPGDLGKRVNEKLHSPLSCLEQGTSKNKHLQEPCPQGTCLDGARRSQVELYCPI